MPQQDGRFALQFLAAPATAMAAGGRVPPELARRFTFGPELVLQVHSGLSVSQCRDDGRELLCLGTLLDPRAPQESDAEILERLLQLTSFDQLEQALLSLGGRFLLLAGIAEEQRVYGDAAGLRTCFYRSSPAGPVLASQPQLIASLMGLTPDVDPRAGLASSAFADVYPPAMTPFPGVRQLLPNHYLNLQGVAPRRFWPKQPVPPCTLGDAANGIAKLLRGSVLALLERGERLALPLTGGYDSRVLLAATWQERQRFSYFTVVDLATPAHDWVIPLRLSRVFGLDHHFVWANDNKTEDLELAIFNTGGMWRDPHEQRASAFGRVEADVALLGNVSEVIRAGFFEYGEYPPRVDAQHLARVAGWSRNEAAIAACAAWLADAPQDANINLFDLFYWEARIGAWSALDCLAVDAFVEVASPYNCRELLALGLGVDPGFRRVVRGAPEQSCLLHREICRAMAPETLTLPFNDGWLGRVVPLVRSLLPRPMQGLLRRLREKARTALRLSVFLLPLPEVTWAVMPLASPAPPPAESQS
jgi:hypothetical protein